MTGKLMYLRIEVQELYLPKYDESRYDMYSCISQVADNDKLQCVLLVKEKTALKEKLIYLSVPSPRYHAGRIMFYIRATLSN